MAILNLKCRVFLALSSVNVTVLKNKTGHIYKGWQKGHSHFMVTLKSQYE